MYTAVCLILYHEIKLKRGKKLCSVHKLHMIQNVYIKPKIIKNALIFLPPRTKN